MITDGLYAVEEFLDKWSQLSSATIALITIAFSIFVPILIYRHQCKEMREKIRQGIISVVEEAEKECNTVKKISELCVEAQIIGSNLEELSGKDDNYDKPIQIAKIRLSEFKEISKQLYSTDKMRNFNAILVENRNRKITVANRGKKIKIRMLEDVLSSIYTLLETNHQLRDAILKKIPEDEIISLAEGNDSETKEVIALNNVHNTFGSLAGALSKLKQNSDQIVEMWENLRMEIY